MSWGLLQEVVGGGLTIVGGLFMIVGAVGLLRMPDIFTRLHAASVIDTAGAGLILAGLMVLGGFSLVTVKLIFIVLMFGLIGPVASHAVARAALHAGIKPMGTDETSTERATPGEGEEAPSKP